MIRGVHCGMRDHSIPDTWAVLSCARVLALARVSVIFQRSLQCTGVQPWDD